MEFAAVILLLALYYLRPQDWVPGLSGLNVVKPVMILGIIGLMTRRRRSPGDVKWPYMGTPHEWVIVVYAAYVLLTTPVFDFTAGDLLPKVLAFFLTLHSLTSEKRLDDFLRWWRWSLVAVTIMGLGTIIGVDFTGSQAATDQNQGRLALHHWMLDNANALGHTLVTLLPLLYFGVIKDRSMVRWSWALVPAIIASVCLWYTQSKGAYLVGAGLLVFSLALGRPWWVKVSIIAVALGLGGTALSVLPRMDEMGKLRADEGVVGRLMAWDMAREVTRTSPTGEGYMGFHANIKWEGRMIPKATHSAYVQVGGDLGLPGLLLYLSALCCGLRTMMVYYGVSPAMDRMRGALFALLAGYLASGWMINRSYHLEFFLILGAIAAYQRLCVNAIALMPVAEQADAMPRPLKAPAPQLRWLRKRVLVKPAEQPDVDKLKRRFGYWRRYGLLDLGLAFMSFQVVLYVWDYVLTNL